MIPEGVLVCLKLGILRKIDSIYLILTDHLAEQRTSSVVDIFYRDLREAVRFYFEHEPYDDKELRRKLRVIDSLYKQYEEMKQRAIA